jgi:DGQHR domain-containing protein
MTTKNLSVKGFILQEAPPIYVTSISGRWLLERTTPSWRIMDPETGFQRVVRSERAMEIALAVLDQCRTFPNAIVLATDLTAFQVNGLIQIPNSVRFLVVDGQHRLWAQKYSSYDAEYACLIHMGLSEIEMARLFLEINDNQKRVPSSLRWDLVRLVRPDDDPFAIASVDIVYSLTTEEDSPLFQRIDLTGEQSEILLKQGSLAPEIKRLLTARSPLYKLSSEQQYRIILQYFISIRELDRDNWGTANSNFYKARVLRALLRLLPDLIREMKKHPEQITYNEFIPYIKKIDVTSLDTEVIRRAQGSAGMKAIYDQMKSQIFG